MRRAGWPVQNRQINSKFVDVDYVVAEIYEFFPRTSSNVPPVLEKNQGDETVLAELESAVSDTASANNQEHFLIGSSHLIHYF